MSFSAKVKEELAKIETTAPCCLKATAYGMLLFGRSFNSRCISIMTEHACVAHKYADLIEKTTKAQASVHVSQAGKYSIVFEQQETVNAILNEFSVNGNEAVTRINRGNLLNENEDEASEIMNCCNSAFLRGAFLSCGTISDPNKGYHLEFVVPYKTLSLDLLKLLTEYGLKAKHMLRRGVNVIYMKDSESIEDLLNIMGATMSAFEIMNIKIYKDFRNTSNRQTNFSFANISRTVTAAFDQIDAITRMRENGVFEYMPQELRDFAILRLENPEASLRELGELCEPALTRSAVNHRLKKILAYSQKTVEEIVSEEHSGGN